MVSPDVAFEPGWSQSRLISVPWGSSEIYAVLGVPERPGTVISGYVYKSPLTTPEGPSAPIVGAVVTCTGGSATVEEDGSFSIELEGKVASGTPILVTAVAVDFEIATKNVTWSGDAPSVVFRLNPISVYGNSGESPTSP